MREGWKYSSIDTLFSSIRNGANIKQEKGASGIPITRIETLANGVFNEDRMGFANIENSAKYEQYILCNGDILMSHINSIEHVGRSVVFHSSKYPKIIHGMNLLRLVPNDEINSDFCCYYFKTRIFRKAIQNITHKSVNQASFNTTNLKEVLIPVPSLSEQQRIVEYLDSAFAKIDALKAKAKENLDNAQALFQAALNEMMTPKEGWEEKEFGKLCHFVRGPFGGYWWLHQDSLFYLLKLSDNQLLLNLCPFQKFSRETKTGQNHRKINIRTLLTEDAFVVQSFQRCKDTNLSRKKTKVCPYFSHFQAIFFKVFSNRITQVDLIS